MSYQIIFQPSGQRGTMAENRSILDAARSLGVELINICGGKGSCGLCKVQILSGSVSDVSSIEKERLSEKEIHSGFRLACQTTILGDAVFSVPPESLTAPQRIQVETLGTDLECNNNFTAGLERNKKSLGLAVDLGTTKIAVYLMDLVSGKTMASEGFPNPQIAYGEDVIARLYFVKHSPLQAKVMQESVIHSLNQLITSLVSNYGEKQENILEALIVGNTAMHHLFLNISIENLAKAPYSPTIFSPLTINAHDVGLNIASNASVHLFPNIAGFVGGDHVAAILATLDPPTNEVKLLIDIGTNTEVCLAGNKFRASVSCASGPAFEGAHIKHGMRAADGAIEHLRISEKGIFYQTIANQPPRGLCGSGILDAVSELYKNNIIDSSGAFQKHPDVLPNSGQNKFLITDDIAVTQKDIREIQLAKAAIQTGIRILLDHHGLGVQNISKVIVAGAFGTYIDIESAKSLGLLPNIPSDRFTQVGNAAGLGAKMALLSTSKRKMAEEIAGNTQYLELASYPDFNRIFTESLFLGPFE